MPAVARREPGHSADAARSDAREATVEPRDFGQAHYRSAYRAALPFARRTFGRQVAAGQALPVHRPRHVRQLAHALACDVALRGPVPDPAPMPTPPSPPYQFKSRGARLMEMSPSVLDAFDQAGKALAALGEEVVLFAYYRESPGCPSPRFSVRLELPGCGSSVQESAPIPATALARALAAREAKRTALAKEETLRRELSELRNAATVA